MSYLYKYTGTIGMFSFDSRGCGGIDMILHNHDSSIAPTRLTAYGALAEYIKDIEGTDAEERYISSVWYYDSNLFLHRIEVPSADGSMPAKVITQDTLWSTELVVFGPQEYIEDSEPECMANEEALRMAEHRRAHFDMWR